MKAKPARTRGTRGPSGGRKATSKKSAKAKFSVKQRNLQSALGDDFWKVRIKIYAQNGKEVVALIVVPSPPKPPITFSRILRWIGKAGILERRALR